MPRVFLTHGMLQQWTDDGHMTLDGDVVSLVDAGKPRQMQLVPAVRFVRVLGGTDDPHGLLHRVKTAEQLAALGAEHYLDSVILADTGYTVVEGFTGTLPQRHQTQKGSPRAGAGRGIDRTDPRALRPVLHDDGPEELTDELSRMFLATVKDDKDRP
jgi:hypothetical protein